MMSRIFKWRNNANIEDHSIYFPDNRLRIPLHLSGVFSYFNTRAPNDSDLEDEMNILYLTPNHNKWNPHNEANSLNTTERSFYQKNKMQLYHLWMKKRLNHLYLKLIFVLMRIKWLPWNKVVLNIFILFFVYVLHCIIRLCVCNFYYSILT